ncbi:helix-turn-helix domain-containing protein [Desulfosporosinus shakirovi]|uniref:helix-turn-helix domain-containing protein n=1 Tax=Desulfosporosinus shakirovi TaxID=2885154 RepID=UPI001E5B0949|nr:helix-turn-helix transcriptional regulator [Desulfosporosinus sp. SRJS8]MCB8814648.1 helix-turn-helix domain-containing protein [Desulfosporosinus sp. SRJS8]
MVLLDTINKQLKKIRTTLKMTQKQLADLVHMDESMINKIENGHSTGSIRTLTKLAAALGVSIAELIGEQSPEQPEEDDVQTRTQ